MPKKVIIVGASSGIGMYVAESFASRGVRIGVAARHVESLAELKRKYPDFVEYARIDINSSDAPVALKNLIDKTGGMDIYFHAAGIGYDNPDLDPEREVAIINTNASGFARMVSAAYAYFKRNGGKGRIAAITSVAGTNGIGTMSAYSASKRCARTYLVALEQLSHIEQVDIKFTDIRPGWIRTPLLHSDEKYPLEMDLSYSGPLIIKAIVRHPRVAVIDWRWGLVCFLWKLIPNRLWTRMDVI